MLGKIINWFEKHSIITLLFAILLMVFIFYMSSKSFEGVEVDPYGFLKTTAYHFLVFFALGFLLLISISKGKMNFLLMIIALLIAMAYGASDELHQLFVPNRACDINDFLVDSIAVITAGVGYAGRLLKKNLLINHSSRT